MKLTWYGHSAFKVEAGEAVVLIDPFFTGNPVFPEDQREAAIEGITHIALTHGHGDHIGDTVDIAKATGATVIGNYDMMQWLTAQGIEKSDFGNTGGTIHQPGFSLTWVQAFHSSAVLDENGVSQSLGSANGLVFHFDTGESLYHMGDTDIFGDMALIEELHQPQVGIVPIGDRFTMGGAVAALACKRYFNFKTIIPCHYGTFPIIDETADKFVEAIDGSDAVKVVEVGRALTI